MVVEYHHSSLNIALLLDLPIIELPEVEVNSHLVEEVDAVDAVDDSTGPILFLAHNHNCNLFLCDCYWLFCRHCFFDYLDTLSIDVVPDVVKNTVFQNRHNLVDN